MKKGIHPELKLVTVTCACGDSFRTLSVREEIKVEICSRCHPFYTGKKKIIDTAGRVEKFVKRAAMAMSEEDIKKKQRKKAKG